MKKALHLFFFFLGILTFMPVTSQTTSTPVIHRFVFDNGINLQQLSDNGAYAVAVGKNAADESIPAYPQLIETSTGKVIDLCTEEENLAGAAYAAMDVTDDGSMVVGTYNSSPGVWLKSTNSWVNLPKAAGYSTAGCINAITPDGKFAVGESNFGQYSAYPCLWDLENDGVLVSLNGLPLLDMQNEDNDQQRFCGISPDGEYILGSVSHSYVGPPGIFWYIYKRSTSEYQPIGFDVTYKNNIGTWTARAENLLFIDRAVMSADGKWVTGIAYMAEPIEDSQFYNEYRRPFRYDIINDVFTLYENDEDIDMGGNSIFGNGIVLASTPTQNPYRDWSIRNNQYWIGFNLILNQRYGIDFKSKTEFENTGTPIAVSTDGKVIASIVGGSSCENCIVILPEDIFTASDDIDLLGNFKTNPELGATFSYLPSVKVTFDRNIEVLGDSKSAQLLDKNGNIYKNSIQFKVDESNPKMLNIAFRSAVLNAGETYTVKIPAGSLQISGDNNKPNKDITFSYVGREAKPVQALSVSPTIGASVSTLNTTTNPIILTFDTNVLLTDTAQAYLYTEGIDGVTAYLSMTAEGNQVAVYPGSSLNLYEGNRYTVAIAQGSISDIIGMNPNDSIAYSWNGAYEREISYDDNVIFRENFDNGLVNMLLYEGDHLTPGDIAISLDFADADNYPWSVVLDDNGVDYAASTHSMYEPAGRADDWMVTPQIYLPDDKCYLKFMSQSFTEGKNDTLAVVVWAFDEAITALNSELIEQLKSDCDTIYFEREYPGTYQDSLAGDWTSHTIELSKYAEKNVYIGFWNNNENQSMIFVDSIEVSRDMNFQIALATATDVINASEANISGTLLVTSETQTFNSLKLILKDSNNNTVSELQAEGTEWKNGDRFDYNFSQPLPLETGIANKFTITVCLDGTNTDVNYSINNLSFKPTKRIIVEEYTGMGCPNCPLGILAMENMEKIYGDAIIPIILHTYTGDIYGSGVEDYSSFLGFTAAPSGIVNRGVISAPMYEDVTNGFQFTNAEGSLWLDYASKEFDTTAEAEIDITANFNTNNKKITINSEIQYAMSAEGKNVNLFTVVMEDNLVGYQDNNRSSIADPNLGEWGKDGAYGSSRVYPYYFNNVARAVIGGYNGTGGYIPSKIDANTIYSPTLSFDVPSNIKDVNNMKVVCAMIDANTGKVINAAITKVEVTDHISDIEKEQTIDIVGLEDQILVKSDCPASISIFSTNGTLLNKVNSNGESTINVGSYKGLAIVKVIAGNMVTSKKVLVK